MHHNMRQDKTNPGVLMPILRGNHIGITLYGGTGLSGEHHGCSWLLTCGDV